jgi:hypothetical protein
VIYSVQVSGDQQTGPTLDAVFVSSIPTGFGSSTETCRLIDPLGTADRQFLRLSAMLR